MSATQSNRLPPESVSEIADMVIAKMVARGFVSRPLAESVEMLPKDVSQSHAARVLNVDRSTIRRWLKSGKIRATWKGRIPASEIRRLETIL